MSVIEWIRFLTGTGCLLLGVLVFIIQMIGIFKMKYVLNRMHAAALGDTLGIGISLVGLMILSGFNFITLKLGLTVVFLWFASPVSSHLIARLETMTNEKLDENCELQLDVVLEKKNVLPTAKKEESER